MTAGKRAHVIVVGNEKGGTGKSTTSMHLIVAFLKLGRSVASIDLDVRQGTLTPNQRPRPTLARTRACWALWSP